MTSRSIQLEREVIGLRVRARSVGPLLARLKKRKMLYNTKRVKVCTPRPFLRAFTVLS